MNQNPNAKVTVTRNGPYRVVGNLPIAKWTIKADDEGASRTWEQGEKLQAPEAYSLCRCGHSENKPFCDGTHARIGFDGTEVAARTPNLEQASVVEGPNVAVTDAESLCAYARFCDPDGSVWALAEQADGPRERAKVMQMAGHCPSGRLVAWDTRTKTTLEPSLPPAVGLVEDPQEGVSGPIWLRGGIVLESADGQQYEVRNRVTVCRCGESSNKPFCDGTHASVHFTDEM